MNNIAEKMTNEYIDDLLVRAAHHSTAIEGNTLTLGDTISILIHNYIPKGMTEKEYYEVKNYKKAFELLLKADRVISTDLTISSKKSLTSISRGWIAFLFSWNFIKNMIQLNQLKIIRKRNFYY